MGTSSDQWLRTKLSHILYPLPILETMTLSLTCPSSSIWSVTGSNGHNVFLVHEATPFPEMSFVVSNWVHCKVMLGAHVFSTGSRITEGGQGMRGQGQVQDREPETRAEIPKRTLELALNENVLEAVVSGLVPGYKNSFVIMPTLLPLEVSTKSLISQYWQYH